jgi:hypothetical protein
LNNIEIIQMSAPSNIFTQPQPSVPQVEPEENNNTICPPPDVRSNINKPLPSGFVAYARRRIEERNREVLQRTGGREGGACNFFGGGRCICRGMGCEKLWNEWIALDCPPAAAQVEAANNNIGNNFGFIGNVENNNSNVSSIKSNNSWNTMARKQEKKMQSSRRKTYRKRRNSRRVSRRN